MGFLHKLWDETLAGPTPDSGLGRLRKYDTFSPVTAPAAAAARPLPLEIPEEPADGILITRSITVLRQTHSVSSPAPPSSPVGSSSPTSPYSPTTPGGNFKKFTRRKPRQPQISDN